VEKIWRKSAIPDTKKSVGNEFVSAQLGRVGQKYRLLAVGLTCRRHVSDFPSQDNLPICFEDFSGEFSDGTLGSILPRRVRFGLLDATISILAFLFESAQGLFLGAIHYHFWGVRHRVGTTAIANCEHHSLISLDALCTNGNRSYHLGVAHPFLMLKASFYFAIKITLQALRFQPNRWHQSIQRENLH